MARSCLFCGGPADSKEHAFPAWLGEAAPGESGIHHTRGHPTNPSEWDNTGFDIQVRQVCRKCNTTWMSHLETRSQDIVRSLMLLERTSPLSASEQKTLAIWAYKTAIMLALAHPEHDRVVPPEHYQHLYEHGVPPHGTFVWIGGLIPQIDEERYQVGWHRGERLDFHTADGRVDRHGYRLSLTVIHLVCQVVFEPYGNQLSRPKQFERVWTRIRPISKGEWPPELWFSMDTLNEIVGGRIIDR